ncbi:hypothetical protein G3I59_10360 [Amycolatopsis rubida]|uniref:Terminal beta-(1->2)-arabinofuranosyltransferase C-terminal domain-containing protein n=1 Tax=Amycolatopsis rubida TaxID=112413 RepID=A0ABX0BT39_9PSEU|nr:MULTISPECIES: hypothetical protein [Amycolatopsis]MYW90993.1 hypothetical protein [Amycolatopsis rubida]NEC55978.1 hypothetical protein [Amycolatopsis rubida]OAP25934.1 hypothetical protein A4R44_03310 [Amycolatopsis sp. M39]
MNTMPRALPRAVNQPDYAFGNGRRNSWIIAGSVLLITILGYVTRWICDDALIFTRIVEQILAGNGPVYNLGERAEASTSTLWQWLLAFAGFVYGQSDTSALSWMLGLLLTGAGFGFAVSATIRLHGGRVAAMVPCGVLVLLGVRPVWQYATSGLETGLNTFWMALCWWLLVRFRGSTSAKPVVAAAFTMGLGPLVRPEQALVAAVFLVSLWLVTKPNWRVVLAAVAAAGALPVGYEIFRMGFYGILVPMPALTKNASESFWGRGFGYVGDFVDPYLLWLPLVLCTVLLAGVLRRHSTDRIVTLTPVVAGVLSLGYLLKVGGDYMHARMVLPIFFLLMLPVLVLPAAKNTRVIGTVLLAWAVLCASIGQFVPRDSRLVDDERGYYHAWTGKMYPTESADFTPKMTYLKDAARPDTLTYGDPRERVLTARLRADVPSRSMNIGVYLGTVGVLSPVDVGVVDFWGLANPIGARFEFPTVKPGHSKPLSNAWLLADYADPSAPVLSPGNFVLRADITADQVAAARHALSCGDLAEVQRSTREPLSPGRFWANLTGAVHRTGVTVPPDPFVAERTFCGGP